MHVLSLAMRIALLFILLLAAGIVGCRNNLPYRRGDLSALQRASREFRNLSESDALWGVGKGDRPQVNFYILRGRHLHPPYLSADIMSGITNQNEVCIGEYTVSSDVYRVVFSLDDPPVLLGVFRKDGGHWRVYSAD